MLATVFSFASTPEPYWVMTSLTPFFFFNIYIITYLYHR